MPKNYPIPSKYLCAITSQVMIDPVMAADGHTYEREAIEEWLKTHDTSPKTNEVLEDKKLRANHDKRSDILDFLDAHPELYEEDEVYLPETWKAQCVVALKNNQLSETQRLLDKDRRLLTVKLENDATALQLASEYSSPQLVDMLLKRLVQKNQLPLEMPALKPAHLNVLLLQAVENNDYQKCELLVKLGAELSQQEADTQNTLLHRMAIQGKVETARWLVEQKSDIERRNIEGNTPLLLSVLHNQMPLTQFLLSVNANPHVQNNAELNAIAAAALGDNIDLLALLVGSEKAALPALHLGLMLNDNTLIKALLEKHLNSLEELEAVDTEGRTPLYRAVESKNQEALKLLVEAGANPTVKDETESNALHIAVSRQDEAMLSYLLTTRLIDFIDAQNDKGDTPLHLAVQARNENIILLLLKAGAYPKIKNNDELTPIKLAKAQQTPQLANFILQNVRTLKKAKLAEQASEIMRLKSAVEKLERQLQRSGLQATASSSASLNFLQQASGSPRSVHMHTPVTPSVNPKEVEEFLRMVTEGEQDQAEAMLKNNPALALVLGDVTDLSKRTFTNITAFQYAVWALDWHMWTMIRKYLPIDEAKKQAEGFETGAWVKQHGVHAQPLLDNLVKTLQATIDLGNAKKWTEADTAWVQQVGGAQLLLPAHVINEYCHPTRSFDPVPNFRDSIMLPSRTVDTGEWFTASHNGGTLGERFACVRGPGGVVRIGRAWAHGLCFVRVDLECVRALSNTRTAQREELINELKPRNVQRKVA